MRGVPIVLHVNVPVFALQLGNKLPLLFVHVKVDAPCWNHLKEAHISDQTWFVLLHVPTKRRS